MAGFSIEQLGAHDRALMRQLLRREPGRPGRFWFCAEQEPHLLLESGDEEGRRRYVKQLDELAARRPDGASWVIGATTLDPATGRYIFYGPAFPPTFLADLAAWACAHVERVRALAALLDTAIAVRDVDPRGALEPVPPEQLASRSESAVWESLLVPSIAGTAAILADRMPGGPMWYWLWPDAPEGGIALLLQPVEWDPDMDRLEQLAAKACPWGPLDTFTGVVRPLNDGTLQFVGPDLVDEVLYLLSEWVKDHVGEHPGLARLRDAQLAPTEDGKVVRVIQHPEWWEDVPVPVVPGTLSEAAEVLGRLEPDADAWFWMTAEGNQGEPYLSMSPVADDPTGVAFGERLTQLAQRFPDASDAVWGTARRLSREAWLFTTMGDAAAWSAATRKLGARPGLEPMATARLVRAQEPQP